MADDWLTLEVGDIAPEFEAELTDSSIVKLADILAGGEKVILYFYPKDSTPGCTTQACDFRDNFGAFETSGYRILGVSKDSAKSHAKFIEKQGLNFDLIVDKETDLHQKFGVWREKMNYGKTYMGVSRSTFVIDTDGRLSWVGYNVRAKGHVERLMRELGVAD
ncbi:MAG: thioredoxin-dependent thiol peroxidase [Candidatus Thalassarchaeaceae archaeon]|jgi:peroxiredoxin Q/BCP|nr:thioredoxin-dependent thiol peroxidase [Candidatus Thalassarchaeaceae archaeon]